MDAQELKKQIIHLHNHPEDTEGSMADAAYLYFEVLNPSHWTDVIREGCNLVEEVSGTYLTGEELQGAVLKAVGAQGYYSALNIVARILGLNEKTFASAIDEFEDIMACNKFTGPISFEEFKEELEAYGPVDPS